MFFVVASRRTSVSLQLMNHFVIFQNRVPVVSSKCDEGELLYPGKVDLEASLSLSRWCFEPKQNLDLFKGDNQGDWACDCKPAYVYYPSTAKCYPVLSKGPCKAKEILVLPVGKVVPKCEANRCDEGKFPFYNVCTKLESFDGCKQVGGSKFTRELTTESLNYFSNPTNHQINESTWMRHLFNFIVRFNHP